MRLNIPKEDKQPDDKERLVSLPEKQCVLVTSQILFTPDLAIDAMK